MSIDSQIQWVEQNLRRMRKNHPLNVAAGTLTEERAVYLQAVASETLQTLTQLRGLVLRGTAKN